MCYPDSMKNDMYKFTYAYMQIPQLSHNVRLMHIYLNTSVDVQKYGTLRIILAEFITINVE